MYVPSPLLQLSDDELLDLIINKLKAQGNIQIGATIPGPVCEVWDGGLVEPKLDLPVVSLDTQIPHVEPPKHMVTVGRVKLGFYGLDNLQLTGMSDTPERKAAKWLYPYKATIPHIDFLKNRKVGELVARMDDVFSTTPYTLTEQDFYDHEYLIFSYALSD